MIHKITLKNNKTFNCSSDETIFKAAKNSGIYLDHSCLAARCKSCMVRIISGESKNVDEEFVLSSNEKSRNYVLSCNTKPKSDLKLDLEDLSEITFYDKKIFPVKIDSLEKKNRNCFKS